jgi:hypothetical protein
LGLREGDVQPSSALFDAHSKKKKKKKKNTSTNRTKIVQNPLTTVLEPPTS